MPREATAIRIGIDASLASAHGSGTGRYAAQLLRTLLALDRDNEYVLYFRRPDRPEAVLAGAGPNVRVRVTDAPSTLLRIHANLSLCLRRDGVELYHSLGFFLPWFWRGTSAVTIHDLHPLLFPEHWRRPGNWRGYLALRLNIPLAAAQATVILTPSEYTKNTVCSRFGLAPARVVVAPNGVDPFFHAPPPAQELAASAQRFGSAPFFLTVGAIVPIKNHRGIIKAFARVRSRAGVSRLLLVGPPGRVYRERELAPLIDRLGLRDAVHFVGYVDDSALRALYHRAVALVAPSFAEGFGLPVAEAMACGTPVVTSNVSALPEVAGDAALCVNPAEDEALAEAMERIATDADLRRELTARGRRRAGIFTWERSARQVLSAYHRARAGLP